MTISSIGFLNNFEGKFHWSNLSMCWYADIRVWRQCKTCVSRYGELCDDVPNCTIEKRGSCEANAKCYRHRQDGSKALKDEKEDEVREIEERYHEQEKKKKKEKRSSAGSGLANFFFGTPGHSRNKSNESGESAKSSKSKHNRNDSDLSQKSKVSRRDSAADDRVYPSKARQIPALDEEAPPAEEVANLEGLKIDDAPVGSTDVEEPPAERDEAEAENHVHFREGLLDKERSGKGKGSKKSKKRWTASL